MDAPERNFAVKIERNNQLFARPITTRHIGELSHHKTSESMHDRPKGSGRICWLTQTHDEHPLSMLRDEMPGVQNNWWVDVVVQVIAQGLVDGLNRLSLVVPEKMFDILEHEGLWARLCEYS